MSTKLRKMEVKETLPRIVQVSALPFTPLWTELIICVSQFPRKFLKFKFCFFAKK